MLIVASPALLTVSMGWLLTPAAWPVLLSAANDCAQHIESY
jgi:hypothetical protein